MKILKEFNLNLTKKGHKFFSHDKKLNIFGGKSCQ